MPLVEYICKKCKKRFSKRDDAVMCEKSHLQVKIAKAVQYSISPYPLLIEATFGDGKTILYIQEEEYFRK